MKTIGLIGGMSWESTALYYRLINEHVRERLGGLHSAQIVLYSLNFDTVETLQATGRWHEAGVLLAEAARAVAAAGADFLVLCTNTMHKVAPAIEAATDLPFVHIADPTGETISRDGRNKVGLLGTRFTMEQAFYRDRLEQRHGLEVLIPPDEDREVVHRVIYEELCRGRVVQASREAYAHVMAGLIGRGAEGMILGCTEITLLVDDRLATVPLYDTTALHARRAADLALALE
ncbi:MAG: aspartate/glutamate racemase family protein [Candidatus Competibacteraceae bacterium]|nr:MAG: aspartate/glutamate racemase family protein [Candidatus Competibacteraceae bacterium]